MVSSDRWVCRQCFADNEGDATHCARCGLARFAGVGPAAGTAATDPTAPGDPSSPVDPSSPGGTPMPQWTPPPAPSKPLWQRLIGFWWVGLIVAVVIGGILFNARRDDSGRITDGGTMQVNDLRVGDCFNTDGSDNIGDVDAVPCAEPHVYELFHVFTMTDTGSFPTDAQFTSETDAACRPAFAEYVGLAYDDSAIYVNTLTPTEDGWNNGDHTVQCVLHEEDESKITGSQRGANR